ncbi:hypothetical protein XYCOK13_17350 [Xylanibacillus composti]|uniref:TRAM domain-containing protein n=1 Tax=Xylanibacillus composti TaxID=1572762 RepID=A0A8J4H3K7_9BACL|nr:hypothetical protein XYCOK13_17350 [Xylanibacillus composti]
MSGLPVRKNDEVVADIVGIGHNGEGVGRYQGFTLFIPGALPGEKALARVVKLKKQFGYGKLLEVVEASPDRVAPPCSIYSQCGGCQLQHLDYEAQLRVKRQLVVDNLERIGKLSVMGGAGRNAEDDPSAHASDAAGGEAAERGSEGGLPERDAHIAVPERGAHIEAPERNAHNEALKQDKDKPASDAHKEPPVSDAHEEIPETDVHKNLPERNAHMAAAGSAEPAANGRQSAPGVHVHPTIGMADPWRYRNKAQVPIGEQEGGLVGGFYAQGSHRIIDMAECMIQHEQNDQVVAKVKHIAEELGIRAYDEQTGRGLLRHVVAKYGFATGEIMIVLITNGANIPKRDELIGLLRRDVPGVVSICQNINTDKTNVIFGPETRVLWGSETIRDAIGNVQFLISARSFYQVNPVQTEILYNKALEYAQLTGEETVIDAYCGIGTISLFLAKRAKEVYGVEIVEDAIADARRNAELNDIRNVTFQTGPAEEVIPAWREQGIQPDVIVVDPPRKGCDEALLDTILAMRPARVVYVSCNPSTLARDLRVLEDGGYRTVEVQPVDMFPHTVHVECVIGICRDDT